ncbi:MAG: hypothetical protein RBU30_22725 [Polyangia bacterium]|jgi:uncharacterized membrane protein YebE (DUF533 family)|nr:hypothetical protein [Polyangia bacterium]
MSQAKVETLKAVLAMAWADGEVSEAEERLADFLIDSARLTPEEEEAVRSQKSSQVDLARLGEAVTEEKDRIWAYEVACLVSLMDGGQEASEWEVLGKLKPVLRVDEGAARDAEARARKIYEKFSRRGEEGDAEPSS